MKVMVITLALIFLLCLAGCGKKTATTRDDKGAPGKENQSGGDVALPPPRRKGGISLEETLERRRSCRRFRAALLTQEEVGQLLWAAGGVKADAVSGATRTAPSAGGIYPLEFYLFCGQIDGVASGVYAYDALSHSLKRVSSEDRRADLARVALGQAMVAEAPVSLVICADLERTKQRYGDRASRYVFLDAGCAAQNVELQAVSMGMGAVLVGAFDDAAVRELIGSSGLPLLIIPLGKPRL